MQIHLLSGFLGSGKTTTLACATALLMQEGKRVGVITNDQGSQLVDGRLFRSMGVPGEEVVNGCFCCKYRALEESIDRLVGLTKPDIVFAESVGSCTDIVATVLKPLHRFRAELGTTLTVFADARLLQPMLEGATIFDEAVRYIYLKQLEEGKRLVVTRKDLLSDEGLSSLKDLLASKYPGHQVSFQDSFSDVDVRRWLDSLTDGAQNTTTSLEIDYALYADGEAKLGWGDWNLQLGSKYNNAMADAAVFITMLADKISAYALPVAHLKFLINETEKYSITAGQRPELKLPDRPLENTSVLVNMRLEAAPGVLTKLMADCIAETQIETGCRITVLAEAAFRPGYPKPAHRF